MADAVSAPNAFDPPPTASDRGVMRETVESKAGRGAGEGERIGEGPPSNRGGPMRSERESRLNGTVNRHFPTFSNFFKIVVASDFDLGYSKSRAEAHT